MERFGIALCVLIGGLIILEIMRHILDQEGGDDNDAG